MLCPGALVLPQAKSQDQAKPDAPKPDGPKQAVGLVQDGTMNDHFCKLCNATFNNPLMAQQHYVGKKHQKQMAKPKPSQAQGTGELPPPPPPPPTLFVVLFCPVHPPPWDGSD